MCKPSVFWGRVPVDCAKFLMASVTQKVIRISGSCGDTFQPSVWTHCPQHRSEWKACLGRKGSLHPRRGSGKAQMPAVGVNQATGGPAGQPDQVARVPFFLCPSEALRGFPTVFPSLMLPPHLLATDLLPSSEPAPQTALPLPSRRCGLPPPPAWSQHTRLLSKAHVQVVMCVKFEVLCIVCPGESVCGFASGV